jgi:hypothetical protein
MEVLADHASQIYFLIGFAAVLAGMVGVMGRRKIWLAVAVLLALLIPAAWLLLRGVSTESTRLEANIDALRKAIVARDRDAALKYVADDFRYKVKKKSPENWFDEIEKKMKEYGVDDLRVERLEIKRISSADREASVSFHVDARRGAESIYSAECPGWKFTLEGDVWKLAHVAISKPKLKGTPIAAEE